MCVGCEEGGIVRVSDGAFQDTDTVVWTTAMGK